MAEITIQKVENNTALAQALIRFVEDFSWEEVKAHTLHTLRNWEFSGWEAVFAVWNICGASRSTATRLATERSVHWKSWEAV